MTDFDPDFYDHCSWLKRADGRSGWILFNPDKGLVYFGNDIDNLQFPILVGHTPATLRAAADELERRMQKIQETPAG